MMNDWQGWLYVAAVLIPLGAFTIELLLGRWLRHLNAYIATAAIATSCILSLIGLVSYLSAAPDVTASHHAHASASGQDTDGHGEHGP
ncbi:MAG: hypothetical protein IRY99_24895, partial [Isosphaeraceae bacterium]|nr:hypothetical protein [Isosphaeraceae bacterium]